MTPNELRKHCDDLKLRHANMIKAVEKLNAAPLKEESIDHFADTYTEALFMRAFIAYECDIEKLFFHYVTGGASLSGSVAKSYLNVTSEDLARKLISHGRNYFNWAKPQKIREIANNYMENGWPICDMMNLKSQELADCLYIRNHIAHNSSESHTGFNKVQRNLLQTERLFPITPGQLLRIRHRKLKKLHIAHYFDAMNDTVNALINPLD